MRSILSGIQKFVQSTPQSDSVSESSQQPKSSSPVMNKSESGLNDKLQSPQRTQFGDSKMVRNESVTASDVQSRSPQRTEIGDPEKAIMVIREHQTEGKASVEQVASPIPPVIVELTDDGDSSVAPQYFIGSAFNCKNKMMCPSCRKVEKGEWTNPGLTSFSAWRGRHVHVLPDDETHNIQNISNHPALPTPLEPRNDFWVHDHASEARLDPEFVEEFSRRRLNDLVNGNGGRSVGTSNGRGTSNDGGASNDAAASNGRESHDRVTSWDW
ncbi:predicted protein [Arabidopsis lyrata subsp. lyrata]|uniref:Predicted protein n=1 Tax=Arabidopsis lyrata subsp. lyrata TaxID=81972 RepID=D7MWW5_ARALL|nr:predicted protein [Arabidopsis lyrata subsp. lyrata]